MDFDKITTDNANEPEVILDVVKEVKKFGDNISGMKKNFDELQKEYVEFKHSMDEKSDDTLLKEKISKFTEAITTRQDILDNQSAEMKQAEEAFIKRMDDIEVALKRMPRSVGTDDEKLVKEAAEWRIMCEVSRSRNELGITIEDAERIKEDPENLEMYKSYKKIYNKFLRRAGGSKEIVLEPEESKVLSVGIDPHGGYTVTPEMSNTIITKVFEGDPIRQLCSVESISTDSIQWLVDVDEAGAGWETETNLGDTTSTPDFRKKEIPVHNMYARVWATQKLLEDSSLNIENWLGSKIADKFMRTEGAAFVTGDGGGKPRGFETYDNGTSWGQVEQVAMGSATALTADGFIDVKYALSEYYLARANAWLMNRTTVQAAMKLKDGSGNYIWKPGLISNDPSSFILGIPVRMSTTMPAVAANALSVALADWKEAYMIVDRITMTVQRDPYTQKPYVEFYARKRVGGDVINFEALKLGIIST